MTSVVNNTNKLGREKALKTLWDKTRNYYIPTPKPKIKIEKKLKKIASIEEKKTAPPSPKPCEESKVIPTYIDDVIKTKEESANPEFISANKVWEISMEETYSVPVHTGTEYGGTAYENKNEIEGDIAKRAFPWRPAEDQKLLYLYQKYPDNWAKISENLESHDKEDCRLRYIKVNSMYRAGKWTDHEIELLTKYHRLYGNKWKLISSKIPGRTPDQVKDKVRTLNKFPQKSVGVKQIDEFDKYLLKVKDPIDVVSRQETAITAQKEPVKSESEAYDDDLSQNSSYMPDSYREREYKFVDNDNLMLFGGKK